MREMEESDDMMNWVWGEIVEARDQEESEI